MSKRLKNVKQCVQRNCPKWPWLIKWITNAKIRTTETSILIPDRIVEKFNSLEERNTFVAKWCEKFPKKTKELNKRINELLECSIVFADRVDKQNEKNQMLFYYFGYGYIPEEYILYKLYDKTHAEIAEYVSNIERRIYTLQMNGIIDILKVSDKWEEYKAFREYYKREVIVIEKNDDFDKFESFVSEHPIFVKKQVWESFGNSVECIDCSSQDVNLKEVFCRILSGGKSILEEKIVQSEEMAAFNTSSVNTVRCTSYLTKHGTVIPHCFMKAGRNGSFVDNGGAGGILIGIDAVTGVTSSDGYDEIGNVYISHPNTGYELKGVQIPEWDSLLKITKELAEKAYPVKYIGWDFAHTENGWVLVEANGGGQMIGQQTTLGRGIKAEIQKLMSDMDLMA